MGTPTVTATVYWLIEIWRHYWFIWDHTSETSITLIYLFRHYYKLGHKLIERQKIIYEYDLDRNLIIFLKYLCFIHNYFFYCLIPLLPWAKCLIWVKTNKKEMNLFITQKFQGSLPWVLICWRRSDSTT